MEQRQIPVPELEQRLLQAIAPVTDNLQSGSHKGVDIAKSIEEIFQQGGRPVVLLRGESGSAKGQIQRELAALTFAEHPDVEMLTSSLAGTASELEKQGVVPEKWEEWTPEHFDEAEQAMVQDITTFYKAHKNSGSPVVMFNETILPLPGFPIGNGVMELVKQLAAVDGSIVPIIVSPTTNDDVWTHTYALRSRIEAAKTPDELDVILHEARRKPVDPKRRRLRNLDPHEVYKEGGPPAAMRRTRGFMDATLLEMADKLRAFSSQPLPEHITSASLQDPDIRQALLEAYQRKLIQDWDFPEDTPIFVMENKFLPGRTIPWHDGVYRRFSAHS